MLVTTTSSPSWGPIRHYKGRNKVIDCSLNMPQFDRYWSQSASSPLSLGQTAKSLVGDLEVRSKCLAKRGHNVALLRIYLGFQTLRNQFLGFWNWIVFVINKLLGDLRCWRWCGRGWGDFGTIMVRLVLSQATTRPRSRTSFSAENYEVTANQEFDLELIPGQEATVLLRIFRVSWFTRARVYTLGFVVRMSRCFTVYTLSLLHHWSIVLKTRRNMSGMHPFEIFFVLSIKYLNFISCGWHLVKRRSLFRKRTKKVFIWKTNVLNSITKFLFLLDTKTPSKYFHSLSPASHFCHFLPISYKTSRLDLR